MNLKLKIERINKKENYIEFISSSYRIFLFQKIKTNINNLIDKTITFSNLEKLATTDYYNYKTNTYKI